MLAILDELGVGRFRLMGHDWGGYTSILIAATAPERRADDPDVLPAAVGPPPRPAARSAAHAPILSLTDRVAAIVAEQVLKRGSSLSDDEVEVYLQRLRLPEQRRATRGYYRSFALRDLTRGVPGGRPDVPLRFIGGAGDLVVRFSGGVELIDGAGHFLPEDKPEAVVAHAMSFF